MRRAQILSVFAFVMLLLVNVVAAGPSPGDDDANTGGDASDTRGDPTRVAAGGHHGRLTIITDERDHYLIETEPGAVLAIDGTGPGVTITVELAGATFAFLEPLDPVYIRSETGADVVVSVFLRPDVWGSIGTAADVHVSAAAISDYWFRARPVEVPPQDDAGSGDDAPRSLADAVPITAGAWDAEGGGYDTRDVYRIDLLAGERASMRVSAPPIGSVGASLLDAGGHVLQTAVTVDGWRVLEWTADAASSVYLGLDLHSRDNALPARYTIELTTSTPSAVPDLEIVSVDAGQPKMWLPGHETREVTVIVRNAGGEMHAPTDVRVTVQAQLGAYIGSTHVEVAPGETRPFVVDVWYPVAAETKVSVHARVDERMHIQDVDRTDLDAFIFAPTTLGSILPFV